MTGWKSRIDRDAPCWDGYRTLLERLDAEVFPGPEALSVCLPPGAVNRSGMPVRFVPDADRPGVDYERHIFETGEVPTREGNWHDLMNALAWCRFPRTKAAMNALHYGQLDRGYTSGRGPLRDALTLFDECGVVVAGSHSEALDALARHDWDAAFLRYREDWGSAMQVRVCGHAILEKFLAPYKAVTAHALLIRTPGPPPGEELDGLLAAALLEQRWLDSPAGLSPLPLAGLPGWWTFGPQDRAFYDDRDVFRPPSSCRKPAPVRFLPPF